MLAKIRAAARILLTLDEKDPKRIFEGAALLGRLKTKNLLINDKPQLDDVLALTIDKFLDRRLQTRVKQ